MEGAGVIDVIGDIGQQERVAVHRPGDQSGVPFDGVDVVLGEVEHGGDAAIIRFARVIPVHGAVYRGIQVDPFHDVQFAALGPTNGADVAAEHPKRRPKALGLTGGQQDAGFDSTVGPVLQTLAFQSGGGVIHSPV